MATLSNQSIIDCDIHNTIPSLHTLEPYLTEHWCDYINQSAFVGPDANDYPTHSPLTARPEARPQSGASPGSDLGLVQAQLLDELNVDIGILTCIYRVQSVHHPDLAAALATALNHWQVEHWLEPEPRLRASLVVPSQNIELAVQEIDRWGNHPGFVQVMLPARSLEPYGNRRYYPLYAAAAKYDLAIGIHAGGAPGNPPTASGWPSTYLEEYVNMSQLFQSQVMSLIVEGAFDQFPTLRVALIEAGFTWMPSLMWRLDKEWKGLRHDIPWVKRLPSDYIREHIRLTTQPVDSPTNQTHLLQIIEQLESEELLMFSSDYPHWHFDEPTDILIDGLNERQKTKILSENARAFYQLS